VGAESCVAIGGGYTEFARFPVVHQKTTGSLVDPQSQDRKTEDGGVAALDPSDRCVTAGFKGKTECIDHVCARIRLHTRLDIVNTKISAIRIKSYYKP
jgi:hypothetical protein